MSVAAKCLSAAKAQSNRIFRFLPVALLALVMVGAGAGKASAIVFSKAKKAEIIRVEKYLNSIKTIRSKFLQISSNGAYSEGDIYFSRPGKMRVEYAPPSPILIIADGSRLIYFDKKLNQVSYLSLDSSPAGILVSNNISFFSGKLTLTGFKSKDDVIRLSITKTGDQGAGKLTLIFSDKPLLLRKWVVTDAQGIITTVTLTKTRFGVPLNQKLFQFKRPRKERP